MVPCLLGGEEPGINLFLHIGMVGGQLAKGAVAQQVNPGITNVANDPAPVPDDEAGGRRSHPLLVRLLERAVVDGPIGRHQRFTHALGRDGPADVAQAREIA